MKNIISYSFFEPKKIYKHRFWDKHNNINRYWYNIPAMVVLNKLIYPGFEIKIHISSNIKKNNLYPLLEVLHQKGLIKLEEIVNDYTDTEPTLWRYKPLLDKECDLLLCRDIDSLPTSDQIRATKYFIDNEKYKATTIRSHTNHTSTATIILAGLCGFRPENIKIGISFEELISKQGGWGMDQNFLIRNIANDQTWTSNNFIDSRLSSKEHKVGNPLIKCVSYDETYYINNVKININDKILEFLDNSTSWAGEPIDMRGEKLIKLLNIDDEFKYMIDILNSNDKLKKFYL